MKLYAIPRTKRASFYLYGVAGLSFTTNGFLLYALSTLNTKHERKKHEIQKLQFISDVLQLFTWNFTLFICSYHVFRVEKHYHKFELWEEINVFQNVFIQQLKAAKKMFEYIHNALLCMPCQWLKYDVEWKINI